MTDLHLETNVYLFGQFCLQHHERTYQHFDSSKALELFCYLLVNRARPQSREVLSVLLWGDQSSARAKKYLRQALWQLQTTLRISAGINPLTSGSTGDAGDAGAAGILDVDAAWVQLNRQSGLWLDVDVFECAYNSARSRSGPDLKDSEAQCLMDAVGLYRGDLLEGWYQDWCLFERERLQNMYFEMLEKLMAYCETHDRYEDGLDYGARILRSDRARERTYRALMRLYYLSGNRTAALREYERCEAALREELGVAPSHSTQDLRLQILNDTAALLPAPPAVPVTWAAAPPAHNELVDQLRQFLAVLVEMQGKLEEKVREIEKSMEKRE